MKPIKGPNSKIVNIIESNSSDLDYTSPIGIVCKRLGEDLVLKWIDYGLDPLSLLSYHIKIDDEENGKTYLLSGDVRDYLFMKYEGKIPKDDILNLLRKDRRDLMVEGIDKREYKDIVLIDISELDRMEEYWKRLEPRIIMEGGYRMNEISDHEYEDAADRLLD